MDHVRAGVCGILLYSVLCGLRIDLYSNINYLPIITELLRRRRFRSCKRVKYTTKIGDQLYYGRRFLCADSYKKSAIFYELHVDARNGP